MTASSEVVTNPHAAVIASIKACADISRDSNDIEVVRTLLDDLLERVCFELFKLENKHLFKDDKVN